MQKIEKKNPKHTKEYAKKLGIEKYPVIEGLQNIRQDIIQEKKRDGFIEGYMKAIEETSAPDLLEALIKADKLLRKRCLDTDREMLDLELKSIISKAK